jgi:hypothetical protein
MKREETCKEAARRSCLFLTVSALTTHGMFSAGWSSNMNIASKPPTTVAGVFSARNIAIAKTPARQNNIQSLV